jgi:phosphopantothenate-cysteine ligase
MRPLTVLITAGGTTEQIDRVRGIANHSTGRLGARIAEEFAARDEVSQIIYVSSKRAVKPETDKVRIVPVTDVASLRQAMTAELAGGGVDVIVHAMAVSDYRVRKVTSLSRLQDSGGLPDLHDGTGKIRSDIDDLVLIMERTPKVIAQLRDLAPGAFIVGFKLLDSVPQSTLIETGIQLMRRNRVDAVLANDLSEITDTGHVGYLINTAAGCERLNTKNEIAAAIVRAALTDRGIQI